MPSIDQLSILCVGAGGIGCEIANVLLNYRPKKLTFIDLDRVEVSNLSRQFYFQQNHVGDYKAPVLARQFNKILSKRCNEDLAPCDGICANIFDVQFTPKFISNYDYVINALDNIPARIHVSQLCTVAKVPLIDSGSEGYAGSVSYLGPEFACMDCNPPQPPKKIPVCSIRSKPTQSKHCIIWARSVFSRIFGDENDENYADFNDLIFEKIEKEKILEFFEKEFKNFSEKISEISEKKQIFDKNIKISENLALEILCESIENLCENPPKSFDKENDEIIKFISGAATLKILENNLEKVSFFEVKGVAGAIIPVVAATNATVAALTIYLIENDIKMNYHFHPEDGKDSLLCYFPEKKLENCEFCSKNHQILEFNENTTFLELKDCLESQGFEDIEMISDELMISEDFDFEQKIADILHAAKFILVTCYKDDEETEFILWLSRAEKFKLNQIALKNEENQTKNSEIELSSSYDLSEL